MFRRIFFVFTFLTLFALSGAAQERQERVELAAGYLAHETKGDEVKYLKGYFIDGQVRLFGQSLHLDALGSYQKAYGVEVVPESAVYTHGLYRNVHTFAFGASLTKNFAHVEPFFAFLIGFTKPNDLLDRQFTRQYRAGIDLPKGKLFARLFVGLNTRGGIGQNRTSEFGAGAGVRF